MASSKPPSPQCLLCGDHIGFLLLMGEGVWPVHCQVFLWLGGLCAVTQGQQAGRVPTLGASKLLCLPKYQIKEMKYALGGSLWASRREGKFGGRTARAVLSPPSLSKEMCLSLPSPCLSPLLLKHFRVFPHLAGVEQGYGKGH